MKKRQSKLQALGAVMLFIAAYTTAFINLQILNGTFVQFQILNVQVPETQIPTQTNQEPQDTVESSLLEVYDAKISATKDTSTIDDSLVVARALGKTTEARASSILLKEQKTKISIVISHCDSPVDWISSFMGEGNFQVSEITVISKCGKEVDGVNILETAFGVSAVIERLPNVGRCDHSYAHWVRDHFDQTQEDIRKSAEDDAPEDLVLFIKDNNYHVDTYIPFSEVLTTASDAGFGCVQKIGIDLFLDCQSESGCESRPGDGADGISRQEGSYNISHVPLELHYKPYLEQFSIPGYARLERDEDFVFKSPYVTLGGWREALGLVFPDSDYINVCYGGNFLYQKRGILSQSVDAWANMEISLARGDNIQEGHYAERSWASLVGASPRDMAVDELGEKVKPFVTYWRDNILGDHGRSYIPKDSPLIAGFLAKQAATLTMSSPTSALHDEGEGIDTTFSIDTFASTTRYVPQIPVFYNVFAPSGDVEYTKSIVKEQMGMALPQHEFLIRTIGTPLTIPDTTLLQHDEEGDEVETLELLWQHCNKYPSDKVVYIHSKGSFHFNEDNNRLRRFLTRGALSDECAQLPGTCNVCSSRMSPMPHPHTSGNMWLARCDYVKKLPQPSKFADMMSRHMEEMHVVTQDCWPCFGLHRFSAEHWIHSHPAVKPCDLSTDESFVADYETTPDVDFEINLQPAPRFELDVYGGPAPCMFGQYQNYRLKEYRSLYGEDVEIPEDWFGYRLLKEDSTPLRTPLAPDAICRLQDHEQF